MSAERKNHILAAAGKCFVKFGYDKTTLDDIAELVGINKASFYYYFRNKEAIFAELITRQADEFIESTKNKVESIDGCKEKIIAWIKESFTYNDTNSILHRLSLESLKKLSPLLLELNNFAKQKGTEYLGSILTEYRKKGELNTDNVSRVAQTIQNIIYAMKDNTYQQAKSNPGEAVDFTQTVDEICYAVALILDGITVRK
jgi:AcrR family transcriptional regulator